jgi:aminoglycoside phosphotransferase family enzyme/predicted kinase
VITEDQTAVIDFLGSPAAHEGARVERIDTHTAIVFLTGRLAWKLKRAVRFDYLDFSTADRRKVMCEAELRLNRRTAPSIYREVQPITREADGSLAINGRGTPIDWVVGMNRFDEECLFDRLAERRRLDLAMMAPLASSIARFHATADPRFDHGGHAGMRWVIEGNEAGLTEFGSDVVDPVVRDRVAVAARAELARRAGELDERRRAGFVRQCHGDLHLRNVVLLDGHPTLFDAVEFNDEIACIDVAYDLAFLLMDLWHRRLCTHANAVLNDYIVQTHDWQSLSLLPLFLSCRAAVRAKTSATAAGLQREQKSATGLQQAAREYLQMADRLLAREEPCVIAIGGFSGSGKSTLARGLAPLLGRVPGAIVLRTDEIRKELLGVPPLERLGPDGYAPEVSQEVYATVGRRAGIAARTGHSVIVDAVFAHERERERLEDLAADASLPLIGLWLDSPAETLARRVDHRQRDASDATVDVIRQQLALGAGTIRWRRIDASGNPDSVLERARSWLAEQHIATREPQVL